MQFGGTDTFIFTGILTCGLHIFTIENAHFAKETQEILT